MKRTLFAVLVCILFSAASVNACVCVSPPLKWRFKASDAVFVGKVAAVQMVDGRAIHTFEVLDALKAVRAGGEVIVETEVVSSCGFSFPADADVLVLASYEGEVLHAYMCSNVNPGDPSAIALAKRRAWWWRSPLSSFTPSALRWR